MKFIKPSEISSKIMTLIEESDEFVIIVSPYVKISKWYKLLKKFGNLKERNIPIEFIIRDDNSNQRSFDELAELGIKYSVIKDLHCKLYLNEKYAIVSSMNLLLSSEINSLELAYQTESVSEWNELKEFCERYLNIDFSMIVNHENQLKGDWRDYVCAWVEERNGRYVQASQENGSFLVNTGINNYSTFIGGPQQNSLQISGILSGKEYSFLNSNRQNMPKIRGLNLELKKGYNGQYDTILGVLEEPLKSLNLNDVHDHEKVIVASKITEFILEIDGFKKWASYNL